MAKIMDIPDMMQEQKYKHKINTIEMDYKNATRQADELEQIAQKLHALSQDSFQPCLAAVAASWKGETASAFCKKGTAALDSLLASAENLRQIAAASRQIAKNTYEAEKRSCEIAQERTY